jgi:hypothetical protein
MPIGTTSNESSIERLTRTGKLYFVSTVLAAQSTAVSFLWRAGTKPCYILSAMSSTLKTTYTLTEAPTVSAVGTKGALRNRNRNYADDGLALTRYVGPTFTGGTVISTDQTGASSAPGQSADSPAASSTYVLKANTDYVVTITPSAACDITVDVLFWED